MTESKMRPSEEALEPLQKWLAERHAKLAWSVDIQGVGAASAYIVNLHIVLVQVFQNSDHRVTGWDAYVAATQSSEVAATLEALDFHCFGGPVRIGE